VEKSINFVSPLQKKSQS